MAFLREELRKDNEHVVHIDTYLGNIVIQSRIATKEDIKRLTKWITT